MVNIDGVIVVITRALLLTPALCSRDAGHEGFNPQLSGQEGGGLRSGEARPTQRPQEPRLYPSIRASGHPDFICTQLFHIQIPLTLQLLSLL